jgi:hypothetical protein
MPKRLELTIEGERGRIPLETFATVIHNSFDILSDLDSAISSEPRGTLEWFVSEVSFGSLVVSIESKSKLPKVDYSPKVVEYFVGGLRHIQKERTTPPYFSDYGLRKAQSLARTLRREDGARAVVIRDVESEDTATIEPEISIDLGRLISVRYQEAGSVEGKLEMISIHEVPRFTVYHAITRHSIRCKFDPRRFMDVVRNALGERVIVSGIVYFNYKHEPIRVELENLAILPREEELPSPSEIGGMSPDFTGELTTEEYIRSLRE